jgi:dTDP-4-amino-4,6-dideoxygalactose transaminase
MIQFLDLKKINTPFEQEFKNKLNLIFEKSWYILGDELRLFESNFAQYCGTKYCIGVGNGLDAITLVLKAYIELGKIQIGDEIIVPATTFVATIIAVEQAGLIPVLVDADLKTFNIDTELISSRKTTKTKAILVVHLYGQLANIEAVISYANANNLLVIEDAAQAHGAKWHNKTAGNLGDAAAFSFYPAKNLGAIGDGGAITTSNAALAEVLFGMRNYGSLTKYNYDYKGINSRLDEIQAAFLNLKLPLLNQHNKSRQEVAKQYIERINNPKIMLPYWDLSENHVFHLFVIRTENRGELQQYLFDNGIQTQIHYPIAIHEQKAYLAYQNAELPNTELIHQTVLSLPISPVMMDEEIDYVIRTMNSY